MVVISDWENGQKYDEIYQKYVIKKNIWSYKQNYPEIVVEDILNIIHPLLIKYHGYDCLKLVDMEMELYRDKIYAILLKRGINKWLAVRKLLIRLKKLYVEHIKMAEQKMLEAKKNKDWKRRK